MSAPSRLHLTPDGDIVVLAPAPRRERFAWAFYDFANTIFSMNVITLYFAVWFIEELGGTSTAYAMATSLSSLAVALVVPILGAISDAWRVRKAWVVGFTLDARVARATALLGVMGQTPPAASLRHLPCSRVLRRQRAFQCALPFYNAMLPELTRPRCMAGFRAMAPRSATWGRSPG